MPDDVPAQSRRAAFGGAAATAALLALCFHPADLGWLAWVAPVPWLVALCHPAARWAGRLSYAVAGGGFLGAGLWWIGSTVTMIGWAIAVVVLSTYYGVFGLAVRRWRRSSRPLVLLVPALWVGLEWVRSWGFDGLAWLYLGHSQWRWPTLIQISDLGGAYLVSGLVALVAAALADAWIAARGRPWAVSRRAVVTGLTVAAVAVAATIGYGRWRLSQTARTPGPRLALIQGNIPQEVKLADQAMSRRQITEVQVALTLEAAGRSPRPDLIIWAETMLPGSTTTEPWYADLAASLARRVGVPVVYGLNLERPGPDGSWTTTNSVMQVGADGRPGPTYDKIHLVPGGEFIPLRGILPWVPEVVRNMVGYIPDVARGGPPVLLDDGAGPFGVLLCNESIFPELGRGLARRGARWFLNPTNDGWFKDSAELPQVLAICCFRAVEHRRPVVRATNTGISAFVGSDGRVASQLWVEGRRTSVRGILTGQVRLDGRRTLYTRTGDVFAIGCLLWSVGALLWTRRRGAAAP